GCTEPRWRIEHRPTQCGGTRVAQAIALRGYIERAAHRSAGREARHRPDPQRVGRTREGVHQVAARGRPPPRAEVVAGKGRELVWTGEPFVIASRDVLEVGGV